MTTPERCMGSSRTIKDSLNVRRSGFCAWCDGPVRVAIDGRALAHPPASIPGSRVSLLGSQEELPYVPANFGASR